MGSMNSQERMVGTGFWKSVYVTHFDSLVMLIELIKESLKVRTRQGFCR